MTWDWFRPFWDDKNEISAFKTCSSSYLQPLLVLHGLAVLVEVKGEVLRVALGRRRQADLDDARVAVDRGEVAGQHVQVEPA